MRNKKAFEIQFNWIFVLVAGAAIMLFFTAVIVKQKSLSEASSQSIVLKSIEAIVTSAGVSTDTTSIIGIPDSDIEAGCGRIALGKASRQYQSLILFSPNKITGDKLVMQTLAFSIPYRATNLLYMTSPKVRYIIITGNKNDYKNLAKDINKTLPSSIEKEYHETIPSIKDKNNPQIKLIILGDIGANDISLAGLNKMKDQDVTAIKATITGPNRGGIEFYQKANSVFELKGRSQYLTKAGLMGAVYSNSMELYECSMKNAFQRLGLVTKVYNERRNKLVKDPPASQREGQCNQLYNQARSPLLEIERKSSEFNIANSDSIAGAADALAGMNKRLQELSCPLIY